MQMNGKISCHQLYVTKLESIHKHCIFIDNHTAGFYLQQLAKFRALMLKDEKSAENIPIGFNFRPVQPLNGRIVYYSRETTAHHAGA